MKQPIIFINRDVLGDLLCVRCEFIEKYSDIFIYKCSFFINNYYKSQFVAKVETYSELRDLCDDYMLNF